MAGKTISSQRISLRSSASGLQRLIRPDMLREIAALGLLLGVAYLVLSIASFEAADSTAAAYPHNETPSNLGGRIGAGIIGTCYMYFGVATYLLLSLLGIWAAVIFFRKQLHAWPVKLFGATLAVCAFASFFGGSYNASAAMPTSGGVVGTVLFDLLSANCGLTGTYLILTFVLSASFLLATDVLFYPLIRDFFRPTSDEEGYDGDDVEVAFEKTDSSVQFAADDELNDSIRKGGLLGKTMSFLTGKSAADKDDTSALAELASVVGSNSGATAVIDPPEEDEQDDEPEEAPVAEASTEEEDVEGPESEDSGVHDVQIVAEPAPAPKISKEDKAEKERKRKEREARRAERKRQIAAQAEAYKSPSAELLDKGKKANSTRARRELSNNAQVIVDTLKHFNIDVEVVDVQRGPTVSLYELKVPPSLQIKKIEQREAELTMMLQASQIRILAPIPGRNTVGIEVPNQLRDVVSLREVVASEDFVKAAKGMQLPVALGLDAIGAPVVRDLAKAPHLLIAGTTGSGKSVMQNVILLSLLLTRHYRNMRMILVDPKRVELAPYNDLPFLATPVITDPTKAVAAFEWLVEEMEQRYMLFEKTRTKKIAEYNELSKTERRERLKAGGMDPNDGNEPMPCIVAMVDELADMMMVNADTRVDELICRIAQKARAAGIHLILATQRPSADVVTGLIKANVPARIGFKLPTAIDSRTIINTSGAEKLLGMGDMLVDWNDGNGLARAQSGFCDNSEIERICQQIREQGHADFLIKPKKLKRSDPNDNMIGGQPRHEKLDEAIEKILTDGRASAQYLRSALRIGYNAATTIVMQMEQLGVIGPARGSKEREILMKMDEWQALNQEPEDDDEFDDI